MPDIHPSIEEHYSGMNEALHERDRLASLVIDLQNKLTITEGVNQHLKAELIKLTEEKNYYLRKSLAYTTTLSNMRDTMQGMLDLADQDAEEKLKLPVVANLEKELNAASN